MLVLRTLMKRVPARCLMEAKAMRPALLEMIRSPFPSYRMVGFCIIVGTLIFREW